jgi:hypothetical protein
MWPPEACCNARSRCRAHLCLSLSRLLLLLLLLSLLDLRRSLSLCSCRRLLLLLRWRLPSLLWSRSCVVVVGLGWQQWVGRQRWSELSCLHARLACCECACTLGWRAAALDASLCQWIGERLAGCSTYSAAAAGVLRFMQGAIVSSTAAVSLLRPPQRHEEPLSHSPCPVRCGSGPCAAPGSCLCSLCCCCARRVVRWQAALATHRYGLQLLLLPPPHAPWPRVPLARRRMGRGRGGQGVSALRRAAGGRAGVCSLEQKLLQIRFCLVVL